MCIGLLCHAAEPDERANVGLVIPERGGEKLIYHTG